ncbi:Adenylylsulfate kinase/AAA domain/Shikimate kinase [Novymonas esmeraldas]|uniref:Gluconokinase n=1 Tax=Novymonas esmeraldas TaxID=1808958 RepID=A0AAW0F314_9TRYP
MPREVTAVVVCGPSGVGKTTIGQELAALLHCPFKEGDDYHSDANREKMRSGVPLTDEDRAPWLRRLEAEVIQPCRGRGSVSVVLACSALRRCYRDVLRGTDRCETDEAAAAMLQHTQVFFLLLSGEASVVEERLKARQGHFMPASLLTSQLAALEALQPTELGATADLADPPELIVQKAANLIHIAAASSS